MSKHNGKRDGAADLLRRSASDERRLLKRERRAERELDEARADLDDEEARLGRAQARVERRRAEVAAVEARLREHQAARATGPSPASAEEMVASTANGDGATAQPAVTGAPAKPAAKRSRRGKAAGDGAAPAAATAERGAATEDVSVAAAMGVPNV